MMNASGSRRYIEYSERPETYIVPVLFGAIFLVGVAGNGGLVWIICRHKSMRSVPNTFIFNLALGDLLVLLITVPFTSTIYTFDSWPYGEFVCKASEFVKDISIGVSVFTLIALSIDRYTATVRSVQSFVDGTKTVQVAASLAVIWTASLALALPAALFSYLRRVEIPPDPASEWTMDANGTLVSPPNRIIVICYPFPEEFGPDYAKSIIMMRAVLHYALPLLVIGTFYSIMAHHLLRSVQTIPGEATVNRNDNHPQPQAQALELTAQRQQQQQTVQYRSRHKVVKMVLSLVVLFAMCFLPMHVFMLWFFFNPNALSEYDEYWHALKIMGFVLAYTNSCINPIALYCTSTSFRKHFKRLLSSQQASASESHSSNRAARKATGDETANTALRTASSSSNKRLGKKSSSTSRSSTDQQVGELPLAELAPT